MFMISANDVKELRRLLKLKQRELAERLGVSVGTVQNYEGGGVIPLNKQLMIKNMLKETFENTIPIGDNINVEYQTVKPITGPAQYETYLLPLSAMGGPLSGFAAEGVVLPNCEKIVSPIGNVDFAITVYGESMFPKYPSGTRLLIKKIDPSLFIDWGKSYVLDTSNGVIVKEVRASHKEGYITCYSVNPDPKFEPFDVPLSEVYGMYRVLMSLSAE